MGRFDALTQLDEPANPAPPDPVLPPREQKQPQPKPPAPAPKKVKKPEIMNSGKPELASPPSAVSEKPEKYSTLLSTDLIKKVKFHATQSDLKDYQVIELALREFFQKQK